MGKQSIVDKVKDFIAGIGWKLFLWGSEFTAEEYWETIYYTEWSKRNTQPEEE